ncbi:MAG: hypothetical protein IPL77_00115 [Flavobacteriales bacterium]|nr:hypothetical protein [Flavobacteriales bacterium]
MSVPLRAFLALLLLSASVAASAQGCVAIRSFTACNPNAFSNGNVLGSGWAIAANYRYFESYRHFSGTEENEARQEQKTAVYNWTNQVNVGLTYNFTKRQGITFILPYSYNTRSSLYEHGGKGRYNTRSARWRHTDHFQSLDVEPGQRFQSNLQLGVGIELPTGNLQCTGLLL